MRNCGFFGDVILHINCLLLYFVVSQKRLQMDLCGFFYERRKEGDKCQDNPTASKVISPNLHEKISTWPPEEIRHS